MAIRLFFAVLCFSLCLPTGSLAAEPTAGERAVSQAVDWLAAHQLKDGGWSFNHAIAPACEGKCANPGSLAEARNAATALTVLALLAGGQAEKDAKSHKELTTGLAFLASQLKEKTIEGRKTHTFEEPGGTMYSHGIATLALSEGFRLTGSMPLRDSAQKALDHIVYAQDPIGGGWRYTPRQPGDTCISGWQISALFSGRAAMLETHAGALTKATLFLDSTQSDEGARYGYTGPGMGPATTASALLNRRRLGWKEDHPAYLRGVEFLSSAGPSKSNLYFSFFATAALRQSEDKSWMSWQAKVNPLLLETQVKEGHARGSWALAADHGMSSGGRHYCTALSAMILSAEHGRLTIHKKSDR